MMKELSTSVLLKSKTMTLSHTYYFLTFSYSQHFFSLYIILDHAFFTPKLFIFVSQ